MEGWVTGIEAGALSLFVQLGGRGSNRGLVYIITQAKLGAGGRIYRYVVRISEGAHLKTVPPEWEGVEVLYTGAGESLPEF